MLVRNLWFILWFSCFYLSLPLWVSHLISDERILKYPGAKTVDLRVVEKLIHQSEPTLDYVFVGGSSLWTSSRGKEFTDEYKAITDKEISALTIGHNWAGFMFDYLLLKQVAKERKIGAAFVSVPLRSTKSLHTDARWLWRWDLDSFQALETADILKTYAEQLLSMPLMILTLVVPPPELKASSQTQEILKNHGQLSVKRGWQGETFNETLINVAMMTDFSNYPAMVNGYEIHPTCPIRNSRDKYIMQLLDELSREYQFDIYLMYPPLNKEDLNRYSKIISSSCDFDFDVNLVNIPTQSVFGSSEDAKPFFYNDSHTNTAGSILHSRALAAWFASEGI